jgi:hypothetical protein
VDIDRKTLTANLLVIQLPHYNMGKTIITTSRCEWCHSEIYPEEDSELVDGDEGDLMYGMLVCERCIRARKKSKWRHS